MYGYKEFKPLTPDEILKRVSEEEIFSIVIKEPIVEDKGAFYKAPYRHDNIGDCYFIRSQNKLFFVDFADSDKKAKNWIDFLKRVYNKTYKEVLLLVNSHFSLGLGDNIGETKEVILENDIVEEEKLVNSFKERVITILPRQFNSKDKQFWQKYNITKQNLIEDKVIPIDLYRSTSRKGEFFTIRCFDLCYAYTDFPDNKIKIYRPNAVVKEAKWFTNCNQNDIGSINHLCESGKLLIISKSYKDCRVLRNLGFNSIWFQNEGMFPNEMLIKKLSERFDKILVWFDNDSTGITNSRVLVQYINEVHPNKAKSIILPPKLLNENIKDPSDLVASKGIEALKEFLILKKLL